MILFSITVAANANFSSKNIVNYDDIGFYQVLSNQNLSIINPLQTASKMLLFENKIPQNRTLFVNKVKQIARKIGTKPDYLMAVMYHESARTFSPSITNPHSGAVGLIQFMPDTATDLNTTLYKLKKMSNLTQLNYVEKYYLMWKKRGATFDKPYKLFLTTFYPASLTKGWVNNKNYIFGKEKSDNRARQIAKQNSGFDLDKDGYISVKDYEKYHNNLFLKYGLKVKKNIVPVLAGVGIAGGVIWYGIYKYRKEAKKYKS